MSKQRVLLVDDEPNVLEALRRALHREREHWDLCFATNVERALLELGRDPVDTVVADIHMPGRSGFELLQELRGGAETRDLPVIILTGAHEPHLKRRALDLGATDLLTKPADPEELTARIRSALRLKSYQDDLKTQNEILERKVGERTAELVDSRLDIIWRLGKAAEFRDEATGNHVVRVGCYCRAMAEALGLGRERVEMIFLASPLHDIGKIGVPDHVLLKEDSLTPHEWMVMKRHCEIGAQILRQQSKAMDTYLAWRADAGRQPSAAGRNPLLEAASSIALTHHERWDGTGYPAGLSGEQIPLEARIVALADCYDALFSERPYRPALPAERVLEILRQGVGTHFDARVYAGFETVRDQFDAIRHEFADGNCAVASRVGAL